MSVGVVNKQTGDRIPTAGMPAIDNALDLTSVNPVQNAVITAALAGKTDTGIVADDFDSTASYVIGNYCIKDGKLYRFKANHSGAWAAADVDEIQITGELATLKSGLTNYENQNNLNLEVANRKNLLPMKVSTIKSINTSGTWSGDTYTLNGMTFTVTGDAEDNLTSVTLNDKATANCYFMLNTAVVFDVNSFNSYTPSNKYKAITGTGSGGDVNSYSVVYQASNHETYIRVAANYTSDNIALTPMITELWVTDPTFTPYIPSVESRIEDIEGGNISGLTLGKIPHTRYSFNSANTSLEITVPTYKAYIGIAHHPWAENTGGIVIINSAPAGNLGCYQTSNVFTITKNGNVLTFTNGSSPMYLDMYELQS